MVHDYYHQVSIRFAEFDQRDATTSLVIDEMGLDEIYPLDGGENGGVAIQRVREMVDGRAATDIEVDSLPRQLPNLGEFGFQPVQVKVLEDVVGDHEVVANRELGWIGEVFHRRIILFDRRLAHGAQGVGEPSLAAPEIEDGATLNPLIKPAILTMEPRLVQ
jgi:hypothetical protein